MSHYMTALAMQQTGLKPATKIVLYWIADHYNHETGACFPSHKRLADLCEMTRQSVITHISILKEQGFLVSTNRTRDNGSNTSCEYKLFLQDGDVKISDTPSKNILQEDVNLFNNHNLVNINLVNETKDVLTNEEFTTKFEIFWQSYPKKTGKQYARKAFAKAIKETESGKIICGCYAYAELCKRENRPKKYTLNPATWLNGGHWDDEEVSFKDEKETSTDYLHSLLSGGILGIENQ